MSHVFGKVMVGFVSNPMSGGVYFGDTDSWHWYIPEMAIAVSEDQYGLQEDDEW